MSREYLIRVLGPVDVVTSAGVHRIGSRNGRALLAGLALAGGRAVPTDQLAAIVWGDQPPASAHASLHTYVSRLRHVLGPTAIERTDHAYRLIVSRDQLDVAQFEDLLEDAAMSEDPSIRAERARDALGLWRGRPFGDLGEDEAFELEALRLDELRIVAMEIALEAEVALGRHELAAAELESAVREHPYRERLWYLLAEALLRDGRRVEALRTCERLRATLAEVGMRVGDDLIDLEQRILGVRSGDEHTD